MCGIIGYIGNGDASSIVTEGLKKLEYRGYDSWGVAYITGAGMESIKKVGKISEFNGKLAETHICIGHSRWSTHGAVTIENAHPQFSSDGKTAVIHNGIIENHSELKKQLEEHGYKFASDTDTEVVVHMIDDCMKQGKTFKDATLDCLNRLQGSFALVILNSDEKKIISARMNSPLVIGVDGNNYYTASDYTSFLNHTQNIIFLENKEMAILGDKLEFYNYETGEPIEKKTEKIELSLESAEKGNYKHFMFKEIMEQPVAIKNTLNNMIDGFDLKIDILDEKTIENINRVVILACGTSWHAALVGEYFIEKLSGIPVEVEYASEFRYKDPILNEKTLCIAISQSGETADTLAA
ncbi:MAG: glutamine--fructose-6-phosphate transaminase (isomerizing), partial [Nanoarchaeota archaeon]|nr:glutamine--fructose-6-phosphate transaminase (isomerizing) [Nanoarchaeota archaeon]